MRKKNIEQSLIEIIEILILYPGEGKTFFQHLFNQFKMI